MVTLVLGLGLGFATGWVACLLIRYRPEHLRVEQLRLKWIEQRSLRAVA